MTSRAYDKKCIALEQLETALRLFREGQDYLSVITLAGAAEEILGKLVRIKCGQNALDEHAAAAAAMHEYLFHQVVEARQFADRANQARNSLKHLNAHEGPTVVLDPVQEAVDMLNRAIDNYWMLETALTESMEQFERSQRSA